MRRAPSGGPWARPLRKDRHMSKPQTEQTTETPAANDATATTTPAKAQGSQIVYGNYGSIIGTKNPTWQYGGFPQPDGTFWQYREPNAVVVVEGDRLRVAALPLTRTHDRSE